MKMNKILITLAAFSTLSFAQATFAADSVATVNGKSIKQSWVDFIIKDATARGQKSSDGMRGVIINGLVDTELVVQEAQKQGLDKNPDFIANQELTNRKLLLNTYLQDFMRKNPITDADTKAKYDDAKKNATNEKEYNARHILVKTEAEAKDIIAQINKGGDFAKIAKEKSIDDSNKEKGGDLGWFSRATMVKPFSDAVVGMKKNTISDAPVQTQFGWHVIKLIDSRPVQIPPYEKVKDNIERALQQEKIEKLMLSLRDKAKIDMPGITDKK